MSPNRTPFSFLAILFSFLLIFTPISAAPQNRNNNGRNRNGNNRVQQTPQQQASQIPQGISTATDGTSKILDSTVQLNGVPLRFKISAPASEFTTLTNVTGASSAPNSAGQLGVNVLLHGDGGQSFFDFPNQAVDQSNLLGVVLLAPSTNLLWGQRTGPAPGLTRADGVDDAQLVRDFVKDVLPQLVSFDESNVFFTGVSGGALLLSGFFMPTHLAEFTSTSAGTTTGVLLLCGAMPPQVDVTGFTAKNTRIHYQSTTDELQLLQQSIPDAIKAFEQLAVEEGLSEEEVGALQTVDNTPNGGHCEFDEQGFVSGIQLVVDNFDGIMLAGGDGEFGGVNVLNSVVGNEELRFSGGNGARKRGEKEEERMMRLDVF
ncbi:hypothetical protein QBC43DRAFT_268625 [Cladorrhinum sp. PSN259]|nr:hypothetical protein QBC43DRAFT_268625 [Cladorrhinum sp. PSN259]